MNRPPLRWCAECDDYVHGCAHATEASVPVAEPREGREEARCACDEHGTVQGICVRNGCQLPPVPTPDPREREEVSQFTALPYWEKAKRLGLPGDMVPALNAACDELFRLRAPARRVTVTAAMTFITGQFLIDLDGYTVPRDGESFYDAMARELRQRIVRALTPDAEGGA